MAEFKKISDVDVINTLSDNDNVVIIGSDGAIKQTSSSNLGMDITKTEVVEEMAEDDKVVLVSNGEVKQVPVSKVGGSGYVVTLTENDLNNPVVDFDGFVISENYDELYKVLCAGGSAWIDMTVMMANNPSALSSSGVYPTNYARSCDLIGGWVLTDIGLIVMGFNEDYLFPNGSHNAPPLQNDAN